MKKVISLCALLAVCPLRSWAEWTGDSSINYFSDEVISDFHVGQFYSSAYFCIKVDKKQGGGTPVVACALSNDSKWIPSFNTMLEQARYFYITGQSIRVYVEPNVWSNQSFVNAFSTNALVGLSSCSASECFGPVRP
ncbi:subtilase cytotoxin subunit B [Salmonella enterica subsp. salamae]|nr:subtilase cytotoxin subunit B [Salmonella enterica subsp. salamae]ECJ2280332.1 subtilase cytotoxin subunit B [Salmonella enterica subsp. salamae]HCC0888390.1 subtilase cytotoxin subunit B [Salmonella enterica]